VCVGGGGGEAGEYRLSSAIGGRGCDSEDREQFGTDKERKGHGLEKVEESLWMLIVEGIGPRGGQVSRIDGCELLLCSTTEEEEIGDDGRQAAARDGTTSLVW